jgi:DNA-binding CsgD family transcriptional regulator
MSKLAGPDTAPSGLLGRDTQLAELAGVLGRAGAGRPSTAVIRGRAGYGKSALLGAVVARASADGWRCLPVSGVESESALTGAGLLAALSPLRDYVAAVPSAQQEALGVALGWRAATSFGDRFLIGAATLSLLSAAASDRPLLIAVDDVQWVDVESAQALVFAARRLVHDPVAVLLTHRVGVPLRVPLDGFDVVTVDGLPPAAARELLGPGFSDGVIERLVEETDGNPLALLECRRTLTRAERAGAASLPRMLPVPDRLRDLYVTELAGLSDGAWLMAVLCAASADRSAAPVFAVLAAEGHDPDTCLADAAGLMAVREGALTFRHPLIRSATWDRASAAERRWAHQSLASVVGDGAARAWHRAEATPGYDEVLADELAAVAATDRSRRGYAAAAAAMERAARLTADPARRNEWLAAATEDAYVAGDSALARHLASEVLGSDAGSEAQARVLVALGLLEQHYGTLANSRQRFERAAELATGRLLVRALYELTHVCHALDDLNGVVAAADRAAVVADRTDPEQAMLAAYLPGAARVIEGRPDLGAPLLTQAVEQLESDPVLRDDPRHLIVALFCAFWLRDSAVAVGHAERRISRARETGALGILAFALSVYSGGLAWAGDHVTAYAVAGEAVELLDTLGYAADPGVACEVSAIEHAARGMHEDAERMLVRARRFAAIHDFDPMPPHLGRTVAFCAFCRGDLDEVVRVLEDQVARFGGVGVLLEPLGVAPLLIESYLGLGRDEDGRRLAERFAAAQSGPVQPYVAAMVARCHALVARDLDEAAAAFERSLGFHTQLPDSFETARTQLLYGMRLRRAGRRVDARKQLEAARDAFLAQDLTMWADRAAQELAGTGQRAHSRSTTQEPLTSQETRVALLVAQGFTNREVAAALFLSPKTIEHHVGAVLRKRGLRSRTELARALAVESAVGQPAVAGDTV